MQELVVKVPDERVPEFYEFFGRWLGGRLQMGPDRVVSTRSETGARLPWHAGDEALASEILDKLTPRARGMFVRLAHAAGERVDAATLAEELKIPNGRFGVAGSLAWPGRHCYAVERELPVRWTEDGESAEYWMEPDVASIFSAAADLGSTR